MKDDDFLAKETLTAHEWRGILELANALSLFEPLAKRRNLGRKVADHLVAHGLAEKGDSGGYGAVGYRLTDLGWRIRERGRAPRRPVDS